MYNKSSIKLADYTRRCVHLTGGNADVIVYVDIIVMAFSVEDKYVIKLLRQNKRHGVKKMLKMLPGGLFEYKL